MKRKYHTYNKNKFLEDTPKLYYWMGFLYADACIYNCNNTETHYKIKLQLSELEPILDFCNYFEINHEHIRYIPSKQNKHKDGRKSISKESYIIEITVSDMLNRFKEFGIVKAKTYNYSEIELKTKEFIPYFLKGIICGDGSFYSTKRKDGVLLNSFSLTGNSSFIEWYCNQLKLLGYEGALNPRIKAINTEKNHITKEINICGTNKIISIYNLLLGESKPRLERKWIKAEALTRKLLRG